MTTLFSPGHGRANLILPALALLGLAAVSTGIAFWGEIYFRMRAAAGMKPFPPFLDLHNLMATAECWARGIDVYRINPCDVLDRLHMYSPLFLRVPAFLTEPAMLNILGLGTAVLFAVSLVVLPWPRRSWHGGALIVAGLSADCGFALERANFDVVIFVMVAAATPLLAGRLGFRLLAYAIFAILGLLKFYPLVLLLLLVRERPRVAVPVGGVIGLVVILLAYGWQDELLLALRNIPPNELFGGTFGAKQLPQGIRLWRAGDAVAGVLALLALGIASIWVMVGLLRNARFRDAIDALPAHLASLLAVGAILICGCFFVGQSGEYRAIFLLFVLPALFHCATQLDVGTGRAGPGRLLGWTAAGIAALMWDPVSRRVVARLFPAISDVPSAASLALWTARELLWWWVVAVLLATLICLLRNAPFLAAPRREPVG